jgi:hypothetical protein
VAAFIVKAMGQSAIKHFEEDVPQVHDDLRDGRAE